ncbi:MAG: 3-oxoacyl-[Oscillospiraceae bacterium]|nr:3-oxoacyl-[acyl-carrier-protein] reductase [Oscillospiraceae bacterium]
MVALITGSARGIGAAIALRLAKDGFDIAFNDISEAMFENNDILDKVRALGVKAEVFIADVSKYSQCEDMAKAVKEQFGSIDVLVNNAGITRDNLMARMTEADYDLVIAVNQKSVFNMMKIVTEYMRKQRHGHIINLASVVGVYGNPGQVNYAASKAAIIGMTKTVAKELGSRNVTCNAVAPGFIHTPMTDKLTEEQKQKMLSMIAMKRYGEPEEIASVVSFLASEDSSYVTGQVIEIAGGLSI